MRLKDIEVFVQSAAAGSFSAAARQLDMTPALASTSIQRLEDELNVRLFVRSTRSLRLSDDGERFLPHARAALGALGDGQKALAKGRQEITGTLRLSAPSDLGRNVLLPWLDAFQVMHPKISFQLRISDRAADLFREPLDAGIRYGVLSDSALVAQPLAENNRRALCAAPEYLQNHGVPQAPEDLQGHNCLLYVWGDQVLDRWSFHLPRGIRTIAVSGDRISDDADVVRRWAIAGHGLVYKSRLDVSLDVKEGRLVQIFPQSYGELVPLNLVIAHRASLTPALQLLRDYLKVRCAELEPSTD